MRPDPVVMLDQFERAVRNRKPVPRPVLQWLYRGFAAYVNRRVPLETALGLAGRPGHAEDYVPNAIAGLNRKNMLEQLAALMPGQSEWSRCGQLAALLRDFDDNRHHSQMMERAAFELLEDDELLLHQLVHALYRTGYRVPKSQSRIYEILKG